MRISAINSYVNQKRYDNIQFQGKKDKREINTPSHSNPLKAIPLAVLLAMSPLNIQPVSAQNTTSSSVTTETQHKPLKVIATYNYEKSTPRKDSEPCYMEFLGRDIDGDDFEILRLNFSQKRANYVHDSITNEPIPIDFNHMTTLDLTTLEIRIVTYLKADGSKKVEIEYFAGGPAVVYDTPGVYHATKEPVKRKPIPSYFNYYSRRITEDFYNVLKDTMGDEVLYKNTTRERWN